jgi:hypothetical protein
MLSIKYSEITSYPWTLIALLELKFDDLFSFQTVGRYNRVEGSTTFNVLTDMLEYVLTRPV